MYDPSDSPRLMSSPADRREKAPVRSNVTERSEADGTFGLELTHGTDPSADSGILTPIKVAPRPLNVLAVEPFYGGERRAMLDAVVRHSRHRWDVQTLPPRKIRNRLATSARWFAEQLGRRSPDDWDDIDVLFTSEAINLSDLVQFCPAMADIPAVTYFHCHHLPDPAADEPIDPAVDFANLSTVSAATEAWFNSAAHVSAFAAAAGALADAHPEVRGSYPPGRLARKARVVPPPVLPLVNPADLAAVDRRPDLVFIDTTDAHPELLNPALQLLATARMRLSIVTAGPPIPLAGDFPRVHLDGADLTTLATVLRRANVFVGSRVAACFDETAIRCLSLGCRPVLPDTGVYPELLPESLHATSLYDLSPEGLAASIRDAVYRRRRPDEDYLIAAWLARFDPVAACERIDGRLDALALAAVTYPF